MADIIPTDHIVDKIYRLRGMKVMLDRDLAALYEVETKTLKRSVRRNIKRFPDDFMFELSHQEFTDLRRQIGTSNWGGNRYMPMAFSEQGVAMLAGILNSDRAIEALRDQTEERFQIVFEVLDKLVGDAGAGENDRRIGFIEGEG